MVFDGKEDWKELLNKESQETLAEILDETRKHKIAYSSADDVKVAQLWAALIEFKNEMSDFRDSLRRVEEPFKTIVAVGDTEKRKTIEKIISELIKPSEEDKEKVRKLAETLMKYQ